MAGSDPAEGNTSFCGEIREDMLCLDDMKRKISEVNKAFVGESVVGKSPCIFKLPPEFQFRRYMPQVISIGPYHRHNPRLQDMEELKWQCLTYLINSSKKDLEDYLEMIRPLEREVRGCYSEEISLKSNEFIKMMVLDGSFLIQFIRFCYPIRRGERPATAIMKRHPLAQMKRAMLPKIYADLLKLENQIPYKVLEQLFETSMMTSGGTSLPLSILSAKFFSAILGISDAESLPEIKCEHLLDLVRSIFIPSNYRGWSFDAKEMPLSYQYRPIDTIPCVSKLRRAGIKVAPRQEDRFLLVNFRHGVIEMPNLILNDLSCSFLVNCVVFEQHYHLQSKHFSVYALFLDCLVNTDLDVEYLCERRVIENYLNTDEDAARFINNLGKGLTFDWDYLDFFMLCSLINDYYGSTYRRQWTSFKREYFDKPWLWISGLVAFVLLVLTSMQTYCSFYACGRYKN